jgi:penicillin-binding protein 2
MFPEATERLHPIFTTFRRHTQEELIADDIPYDTALRLLIESSENAALQVSFVPRREYLVDDALAPTLGYVGSITADELRANPKYQFNDVIGKAGVEKKYETTLRGTDGFQKIEVDALGREKGELALTPPQKGGDITMTIDMDVQKKLYEVLLAVSKTNNGTPAAGIVLSPATGEILGIASVPSYDPAIFTGTVTPDEYDHLLQDPKKPLFARAIGGVYPAGSTFKLAIASAALEEKLITDSFTVMSTGGIHLGDHLFPDWRLGGHGITNVYKAISDSVNTFFYIVGGGSDTHPGLGVDVIDRYASLFGFGAPTGVDLPGEAAGFVPSRAWKEQQGEKWYQGDTYNLSIGQGALTVTPLQVARYTSFFANGGTLTTPHVVREYSVAGQKIPYHDNAVHPNFLSADTIRMVRQGMRRTVTDGTATSMQSVHAAVAGKTGTAQFNHTKDPHSWFTGFAPFERPEIVITVLVEEGGERGLAVSAARRFMEWYFNERS